MLLMMLLVLVLLSFVLILLVFFLLVSMLVLAFALCCFQDRKSLLHTTYGWSPAAQKHQAARCDKMTAVNPGRYHNPGEVTE